MTVLLQAVAGRLDLLAGLVHHLGLLGQLAGESLQFLRHTLLVRLQRFQAGLPRGQRLTQRRHAGLQPPERGGGVVVVPLFALLL